MMKRFTILLMTLLLTTLGAQAQEDDRQQTISGQVIDAELREPMVQASVQLFRQRDSTFVGGSVTDLRGNFSVEAPGNGIFRIKISSVGFQPIEREVTLRRNQSQDLGTLMMSTDAVLLKEAVVTGRAAQVMVKKDTLVYNPDAFRTPEGSPIEELIKRMPGAEVDEDGNITVNGKAIQKILIDGKEFMLGDVETALKNLPVSIIQNVKFYDQQSDQARITGIEDGNKETVLDFTIKKGMNRGYMTNLDIAGGTEHRYASRGMGSSFTDNMRFVLMGNFNNKEENAGWWNRRGLNSRKMLGTNLNYDDGEKLKIDASVRWNHRGGDNENENSSENFYSQDYRTFSNSQSRSLSRSNNWNGNVRFEWKPDSLTNILFRANGSYGTNDGISTSASATFDADPYLSVDNPLASLDQLAPSLVNHNQSASLSYGENKNAWGMLQLYRRLNARGRNITVRFEGSIGDSENRNTSNNDVHLYRVKNQAGQDSTYFTARYNTTPSDNKGYVTSVTYSEPLWEGAHLQANYELRYNQNKSDRQTYEFSRMAQNPFSGIAPDYREWDPWLGTLEPLDPYLDPNLSRYSEYKNYTHNIRLTLRHYQEEYDYNVGVLVQPQHSNFIQDYRGIYVDTIRNVTNVTPTLDFHYKFSDQHDIWFHYRGDTRQPEITQLLAIRDDSNPLYITEGNPGLKPQFTNSLNVYYKNYISKYKRSIVLYGNYRHIRNSISNLVRYNAATGGSESRPENINGNWNADGGFNFNTAIDSAAHWNVGSDTRLRYNNYVSYVAQAKADAEKNTTRTTNVNQRLNISFRNDWLEVTLDGNVNYQHSRNELQPNANLDTWRFSYGGQVMVRLPMDFEISTNLHENSRRGFNDPSSNTNELIWNGQVSKMFLKDKSLIVALNFYDVLAQQSNYERWVNATGRSDTRYNSINTYAMLHVRYRLNIFGGKADTEGRYDKKWGNRDGSSSGGRNR
ncbi:TonB-dependent receptor [uncultured Prevotella sp.]|uniref:TonB-dependent receptor n=1 Tax=uncultured Prevotella sp. TaxID=159272 RepID=UPI0025D955D5|nr:TonB-dependent receptor [uncultured Prevotella sp.]